MLDKSPGLCYTIITKGKELHQMSEYELFLADMATDPFDEAHWADRMEADED